jgi:hypothetical protein
MGNGFCLKKTPNDDIFFVNCEFVNSTNDDTIYKTIYKTNSFNTNIYLNKPISLLEKAILNQQDINIKEINIIYINHTKYNSIDKNKTLQEYYNSSKGPSISINNILRNYIEVR